MPLKYEIPQVGESFSEKEILAYAESESYEIKRIGNHENGEMLLVLHMSNTPAGMSFLLCTKGEEHPFTRIY